MLPHVSEFYAYLMTMFLLKVVRKQKVLVDFGVTCSKPAEELSSLLIALSSTFETKLSTFDKYHVGCNLVPIHTGQFGFG